MAILTILQGKLYHAFYILYFIMNIDIRICRKDYCQNAEAILWGNGNYRISGKNIGTTIEYINGADIFHDIRCVIWPTLQINQYGIYHPNICRAAGTCNSFSNLYFALFVWQLVYSSILSDIIYYMISICLADNLICGINILSDEVRPLQCQIGHWYGVSVSIY